MKPSSVRIAVLTLVFALALGLSGQASAFSFRPFKNARTFANYVEDRAAKRGLDRVCRAPSRYKVVCSGDDEATGFHVVTVYNKVAAHTARECVTVSGGSEPDYRKCKLLRNFDAPGF